MTRNGNGNGADDISGEIARVTAEIARVEAAGLPLPDLLAAMNAAFDSDLEFFRRYGFDAVGFLPRQREVFQTKSLRGALIATSGATIRKSEQARIERQFEAAGGFGLSEADKQLRLGTLRAKLRQLQAKREIAWRAKEATGEAVDRSDLTPEMFLRVDQDLEGIAAGREAA